ncbi:MAG: glycerophosphodiester phosphodiesterase family protein [Candidatus Hydrogenedens sp.]|nr:glycerophosphodiester phosphodiesterase family protein [Candidatus Hydrogenedens sp.]
MQNKISLSFVAIILCNLVLFHISFSETYVCAHRGDVKNAPENTIPAFKSAIKKGAHMIEFDVRMTKDGHLVLMHDATVDRTTNGSGKVSELTSEEIYKLDAGIKFNPSFAGTKIPSMAEAVNEIPYGTLCNVHVYGDDFVTEVVAITLKQMGHLGHCFIACNNEEQVHSARNKVEDIKTCLIPKPNEKRSDFIERAIKLKVNYVQINIVQGFDGLKEDVEKAHNNNIKVNFFSAQDEPNIRKLAEAGVDYILTDNIDLCFEVLKSYGTKPLIIDNEKSNNSAPTLVPTLSFLKYYPLYKINEK